LHQSHWITEGEEHETHTQMIFYTVKLSFKQLLVRVTGTYIYICTHQLIAIFHVILGWSFVHSCYIFVPKDNRIFKSAFYRLHALPVT